MADATIIRTFLLLLVLLSIASTQTNAQRGTALPEDMPLLLEDGYRLQPGDTLCMAVELGDLREEAFFVPGTETAVFDTTRLPIDFSVLADTLAFSDGAFHERLDEWMEQAEDVIQLVEAIDGVTQVCAEGLTVESLPEALKATLASLGLTAEYAAAVGAETGTVRLETLIVSGTESGVPVPVAMDSEVFQNGRSVRHQAAFFVPQTFVIPDTLQDGEAIVMVMDALTYRVTRLGNYEPDTGTSDYRVTLAGEVESIGGMTIPVPRSDDITIPETYRFNLSGSVTCIADCGSGKNATAAASTYRFAYVHAADSLLHLDAQVMYEQGARAWRMSKGYIYGGSSTTATSLDTNTLPHAAQLKGNYPNPFNPTTTIRYALPAAQQVHVAVYDALGREVAVLVDDWQPAGTYDVLFDAQTQASGIYLYCITTGDNFAQTRTMTLLK